MMYDGLMEEGSDHADECGSISISHSDVSACLMHKQYIKVVKIGGMAE